MVKSRLQSSKRQRPGRVTTYAARQRAYGTSLQQKHARYDYTPDGKRKTERTGLTAARTLNSYCDYDMPGLQTKARFDSLAGEGDHRRP